MATQVKHRNYFNGSLEEFKQWYALIPGDAAGDKIKADLKKTLTLIGAPEEDGIVKEGYIYARGTFYKLSSVAESFDPSEYPILQEKYKIWFKEDYGQNIKSDKDLISKGYLEEHTSFENLN